jgi:hypothetical protein
MPECPAPLPAIESAAERGIRIAEEAQWAEFDTITGSGENTDKLIAWAKQQPNAAEIMQSLRNPATSGVMMRRLTEHAQAAHGGAPAGPVPAKDTKELGELLKRPAWDEAAQRRLMATPQHIFDARKKELEL